MRLGPAPLGVKGMVVVKQSEVDPELDRDPRSLRDSEALFRSVFNYSPSGIVVADRSGKIVRANQAFCHMLGYSEAELSELTILDLTHPDDRDESAKLLRAEHQGVRATADVQKRYVRKDGKVVWGHVIASTLIGTKSRPVLRFAIVQDTTARVEAEEETRRESQFLQGLVDAAQAIILVVDTEGRIVQFNRYMEELSGYELDEVRGQDWFKTFSPSTEHERLRFLLQDAVPQLSPRGTINTIRTRGGRRRLIQWSAETLKEPDGTVSGILSIGIDITDQRHAEREVQAEKERSRAILATAFDGIVTTDEQGIIESFNPSAERMFGYLQDEVVGQSVCILMPPADRIRHEGHASEFLRSAVCRIVGVGRELEACHSNGRVFPIHLSLAEMQVGDDRGFCAFIRDLTESKRVEEQLRQSQKMEAIGSLASGVAHDFNNLLMGVSGCASVALECVESGRSDRMYLTEIKKAAESGTAMTKQLLAFSRKVAVKMVLCDFDEMVASQEALLRRLLGEDIEFTVNLQAGEGLVRADVGQIDQVLMNLAVNARDAMPTGGRLKIETKVVTLGHDSPRNAELGEARPAGRYVALTVADDGEGMSAETRARLFEPFYTTKQSGKGTGLGLATVYGIIKQSSGHIDVQSVEPRGTRFEILLPLVEGERITKEHPAKASDKKARHGTILVCEDDRLVRMAIQYYLEGAGYRVLKAPSAAAAIECCTQFAEHIDLLLTDVVLPDQSGERIARKVRELKPGIKVLYMSAHTAEWLKSEGRIDDELQTLQKPFDEDYLLARIASVLEKDRAHPELMDSQKLTPPPQSAAPSPESAQPVFRGEVLVVEDSSAARLAIAEFLRGEGWRVATAGNGTDALSRVRSGGGFDVLLVDYSLPDMKGDELAGQIRRELSDVSVVYMSGYSGLRLDPPGPLLTKPLDLDTLTAMLQALRDAPDAQLSGIH